MADLKIVLTVVDKASGQVTKVRRSLKDLADGTEAPNRGLSGLTANLGKVALAAGGAFAAFQVLRKAKDYIGDSIGMASNLNETINKTGVVFENNAARVLEWAKSSVDAMGQTRNEALSAASAYGNLFTTMGLSEQVAADMSMRLVELASDLASFHNIASSDALDKLRSGLVGEAEPMRALGVLLDETTVKAKAAQMGFKEVDGQLSQSAKVQARFALILEQTGKAQGDFARTSGEQANAARIASAAWEEIQTAFGQRLLPVVRDVTVALAKTLPQALKDLEGPFDTAGSAARGFADMLQAVAQGARDAGEAVEGLLLPPLRALNDLTRESFRPAAEAMSDYDKEIRQAEQSGGDLGQMMDNLGQTFDDLAHRAPGGLAAWVHDFYESERAAMEAEKAVERANRAFDAISQESAENARYLNEHYSRAFENVGTEAERAAARAAAAMQQMVISAAEARWAMAQESAENAEYLNSIYGGAAKQMGVNMAKDRDFWSGVVKGSGDAASAAKRALEEGIRRSADAASQAVSGLRRALDSVLQSPLFGSTALTRRMEDIQDQIAVAEYRVAQMRQAKAPRSDIRRELKGIAALQEQLNLLGLQERATIGVQERQVTRAITPTLPELTVEQKITAAQALQGQVMAAEAVAARYETTNHIEVNVTMGGGSEVVSTSEEGRSIGRQIAEALEQMFSGPLAVGPGAGRQLPGAAY